MPNTTFYNLNKEKKEKIEKALKHEFTKKTFEKASISNIIEEANIPRGSFYQYFEDKEDAFKYLIEDFLKKEKEKIEELLIKNKGDIFLTTLDLYTYFVEKNSNDSEVILFQNIINKLRSENVNIYKDIKTKQMISLDKMQKSTNYIDTGLLAIDSEEEIQYILKILTCVLRAEIIDVMQKKVSKEERKIRIN